MNAKETAIKSHSKPHIIRYLQIKFSWGLRMSEAFQNIFKNRPTKFLI